MASKLFKSHRLHRGAAKVNKIRLPLLIGFGLIGAFVVAYFFGGNSFWGVLKYRRATAMIQAESDSLLKANSLMRERAEKLKNADPFTIEEEARSHGMVYKGEKVVKLKSK